MKFLYAELFWSVFSRIWTEYEQTLHIASYSFRMRENTDQNNCEYIHILLLLIHVEITILKRVFRTLWNI